MTNAIIALGITYFVFSFIYFAVTGIVKDHHYLNPINNYYYEWKKVKCIRRIGVYTVA